MRRLTDQERIKKFMRALGAEAKETGRVYLTGGSCAVLLGWRSTTIDIDLKMVPEQDQLLRAILQLKEDLKINVELVCPADFIPEIPEWASRSPFVGQEGRLSFYHYDFYSQTLAKIERGHAKDLADVRQMISKGLIEAKQVMRYFDEMEPNLYRYPAIDPASFRKSVYKFFKK